MIKIASILIILYLISLKAFSQINPIIVKVINKNTVAYFDLASGSQNILYTSQESIIEDLTVSAGGGFLAFIEMTEGTISGKGYKVLPHNTLKILDTNTDKVFYSIPDDVRAYKWSPQGNKIAYITGKYYEGGVGFSPENTYIIDLKTKAKTKIEGPSYPYELHWGMEGKFLFMKNTYLIDNTRVFKFDLDNMTLSPTPYHDLHFSPDGQYYAHYPDEVDSQFRLFLARTNEELPKETYAGLGSPMGWVFDSGHLFLFVTKDEETKLAPSEGPLAAVKERTINYIRYSIFHVGKKRVVKELENVKIGEWVSQNSILPFSSDGKVDFIEKP